MERKETLHQVIIKYDDKTEIYEKSRTDALQIRSATELTTITQVMSLIIMEI